MVERLAYNEGVSGSSPLLFIYFLFCFIVIFFLFNIKIKNKEREMGQRDG